MRGAPKVTFVVCGDGYRAVVDNLEKCFISLSVADMAKKAFIGKESRGQPALLRGALAACAGADPDGGGANGADSDMGPGSVDLSDLRRHYSGRLRHSLLLRLLAALVVLGLAFLLLVLLMYPHSVFASNVDQRTSQQRDVATTLSFIKFPKDKTLRDAWQRAVRRDVWEPKNADVLCSEHFEANCFDRTGQTTRLRPGSIPTIFPAFPAHLQKPAKRKREAPKCRTALSPVVSAEAAVEMPSEPSSPAKDWYRSKAEESAQEVLQLKKKVKTLQQSKRRLSKRCDASENLIKELKERKLLSEKGLEVFEATISPEIQQLLVRAHEKTNKMYPPELRAFALTLQYYSAAAYEYVRSKFNNALPSQRTLPKSQDKPLIAALMMDDMAIKKHVQLVGKKVVGYIDLGTASVAAPSTPPLRMLTSLAAWSRLLPAQKDTHKAVAPLPLFSPRKVNGGSVC
ncbi:hypothetical protein HPB51_010543 [Rhipicephalus microplus]|uniref:THAP-type domain-containing protein n=1 Tax=Rhipicephalus microplus TaxID=6941 RepID=A0A9J6D9H2_RHIMP|nr:hypothetical protein HPB51_010543 [Rhipicephalus microplus]